MKTFDFSYTTVGTDAVELTAAIAASMRTVRCEYVTVQNDPTNTVGVNILVGSSTAQKQRLTVGGAYDRPCETPNEVYIKPSGAGIVVNGTIVY